VNTFVSAASAAPPFSAGAALLSSVCAAESAEFAVLLLVWLSLPQPVADSANAAVKSAAQSVFFQKCFIF
jgi:hypothetical protein